MKRLPIHERIEEAKFEGLEARLLLAAAPFVQPDGPMPQAGGPGCGPPVEQANKADGDGDGAAGPQAGYDFDFDEWVWFGQDVRDGFAESLPDDDMAAGADGDGKLGLNDVKTSATGEPTSLTFNGRGIDLNEDEKVDALASVHLDGFVTRLVGVHNNTSSTGTDGFVQDPQEKCDPAELPIIMDVLGSTKDFEMAGADGVVFRMLGVDNDTDGAGADALAGAGVGFHLDVGYEDGKLKLGFSAEEDDIVFLVPEFNPYEQAADSPIVTSNGMSQASAGHCRIMAVRVANPEPSGGSGGPMKMLGSLL